jgi:hypothetical protein
MMMTFRCCLNQAVNKRKTDHKCDACCRGIAICVSAVVV